MQDICPVGVVKNLTTDAAPYVSFCSSVGRHLIRSEGCEFDSRQHLRIISSVQLDKHFHFNCNHFVFKTSILTIHFPGAVEIVFKWGRGAGNILSSSNSGPLKWLEMSPFC